MARYMARHMLEAVLERDRLVAVVAIAVVVAASWIYILAGAGTGMSAFDMTAAPGSASMSGMDMDGGMATDAAAPAAWSPGHAVLMLFMWWIMMVAMMLPSAAPMILLYARIDGKRGDRAGPLLPTGAFVGGYLLVWGGFSLAAVLAHWGLARAGLLSPAMASTSVMLGGGLLLAAGVWQLTPLKHACLRHCRSPIQFLSRHWRDGRAGALRMGVAHGAFCLGCCWSLMALLFYGGVMNLYWIIGLALFVLVEKTAPAGPWVGRVLGVGLIAWGAALLALGA